MELNNTCVIFFNANIRGVYIST